MDTYFVSQEQLNTIKIIAKHINVNWRQIAARPKVAVKMIKEYSEQKSINGVKV